MFWLRVILTKGVWLTSAVLGLLVFVFILSRAMPIDPAILIVGENASEEQVEMARDSNGFSLPISRQFVHYLAAVAKGDLGSSFYTHRSITGDLRSRLPATFELTMYSVLLAAFIGLTLGVLCGVFNGTWIDHFLRILTVAAIASTHFWIAIQLQLLFAMKLDWLPLAGRISVDPPELVTGLYTVDAAIAGNGHALLSALQHLIMPVLTLGLPAAATIQRFVRNSVINHIQSESVMFQVSMGLPYRVVIWKYVLRTALAATVTLLGLTVGAMLTGAVAVEAVFDWPGLGSYAVQSVLYSDYNAIMGLTLLSGVLFALLNASVDVVQIVIDPRRAR
jgi:peptide/nickel transport system permease protein